LASRGLLSEYPLAKEPQMTNVSPVRVLIADDRNDPLLHHVIEALLEVVPPTNPRKEKVDAGAPPAPLAMGRSRRLLRSGKPPPHCV
jgi:hypothetical protein